MKLNNNEKIPFKRQSDIFIKNNELTSHKHHTYEQLTYKTISINLKKNLSGLNLEIK